VGEEVFGRKDCYRAEQTCLVSHGHARKWCNRANFSTFRFGSLDDVICEASNYGRACH
jgi:hypothetical protein